MSEMNLTPHCRFCEALSANLDKINIVEYRDTKLFIGGANPTDQQIEEMAKEVELLEKMSIWGVLTDTVKAQGVDLGIKNSKDFDQLMFAKAMLHVVGVQKSIVEAIKQERALRKQKSGV